MSEYLLPIIPDYNLTLYVIGVVFSVFIIGMLSILKDYNVKICFTGIMAISICAIGFTMWYITPIYTDYDNNMMKLIETTDCANLPNIAHERNNYKNEIVDEIVLRCLIDNNDPELISFLKGAT